MGIVNPLSWLFGVKFLYLVGISIKTDMQPDAEIFYLSSLAINLYSFKCPLTFMFCIYIRGFYSSYVYKLENIIVSLSCSSMAHLSADRMCTQMDQISGYSTKANFVQHLKQIPSSEGFSLLICHQIIELISNNCVAFSIHLGMLHNATEKTNLNH